MSVNHTPGPWTLETVKTSCGICHKIGPFPPRRDSEEPGAACIYVDYYSPGNPRHEELKANAELIRSAPELAAQLAALKEENERLTRELADEKLIVTQKSLHIHDIEGRLDNAEARVAELEEHEKIYIEVLRVADVALKTVRRKEPANEC